MPLDLVTLDDLAMFVTRVVGDTPQRVASEGYLINNLLLPHRQWPRTLGETEARAALAIAVEKGWLEYATRGLRSTDGTMWVQIPRERPSNVRA